MIGFRSVRQACAVAASCACLFAASGSNAGTLVTTGFANGYEIFDVNAPTLDGVAAGGFTGTWEGSLIAFWCAELTQSFSPGNVYTDYTSETASGTAWTNLGRLFTEVAPAMRTSTTDNSAAFQLAVWEVLYENAGNLRLNTGTFQVTNANGNTNALTIANDWLANLPGTGLASLSLLHSPESQDFVTELVPRGFSVPEPAPLALVALGIGALLVTTRRGPAQSRA